MYRDVDVTEDTTTNTKTDYFSDKNGGSTNDNTATTTSDSTEDTGNDDTTDTAAATTSGHNDTVVSTFTSKVGTAPTVSLISNDEDNKTTEPAIFALFVNTFI